MNNNIFGLEYGFAIQSLDGNFMSKNFEWEKKSVENCHAFEDIESVEKILGENSIFSCYIIIVMKIRNEWKISRKILRNSPRKYVDIPRKEW